MAERFTSERVLELLFDDDFDLSGGSSSDEDWSEGPSVPVSIQSLVSTVNIVCISFCFVYQL